MRNLFNAFLILWDSKNALHLDMCTLASILPEVIQQSWLMLVKVSYTSYLWFQCCLYPVQLFMSNFPTLLLICHCLYLFLEYFYMLSFCRLWIVLFFFFLSVFDGTIFYIQSFFFQIGEVVDGPDDNMKRPVLDGIEYDYGQCLMFFGNF